MDGDTAVVRVLAFPESVDKASWMLKVWESEETADHYRFISTDHTSRLHLAWKESAVKLSYGNVQVARLRDGRALSW